MLAKSVTRYLVFRNKEFGVKSICFQQQRRWVLCYCSMGYASGMGYATAAVTLHNIHETFIV